MDVNRGRSYPASHAVLLLVVAPVLLLTGCRRAPPSPAKLVIRSEPGPVVAPEEIPPGRTFVVAASGDIAGDDMRQPSTAAILSLMRQQGRLSAVLALGDLQ